MLDRIKVELILNKPFTFETFIFFFTLLLQLFFFLIPDFFLKENIFKLYLLIKKFRILIYTVLY